MKQHKPPRAIALGYFDGVHMGHRALMQRAVQRAHEIGGISAVFTFDKHPSSVMTGRQVPLLTADAYRQDESKRLGGVDEVIFGHFEELRTMDWRDFIHELLIGRFGAGYIISGHNNRFGYMGRGTPEGMAEECRKAGIGYDCIPDVKIDGIVVSSTYIRQLISLGDMQRAARFLQNFWPCSQNRARVPPPRLTCALRGPYTGTCSRIFRTGRRRGQGGLYVVS